MCVVFNSRVRCFLNLFMNERCIVYIKIVEREKTRESKMKWSQFSYKIESIDSIRLAELELFDSSGHWALSNEPVRYDHRHRSSDRQKHLFTCIIENQRDWPNDYSIYSTVCLFSSHRRSTTNNWIYRLRKRRRGMTGRLTLPSFFQI